MESNDNITNSANASVPVSDKNSLSKTEVPEWPILPTFLSLRKGKTEENANYNNDGIYYTDYIRGFLADLSYEQNIQNALSIFQFVPKDYQPYDPNAENPNDITTDPRKATVILNEPIDPKIREIFDRQDKKIIRIDSGTYVNNGRLCDAFRKCHMDHTSFCFRQDSIVGIFADEALNELQPNKDEYCQRLETLIVELNKNRKEGNKIKCDTITETGEPRRIYIHYTCPYSLFEEHIFPIYAQGRVIACLMYGQVGRDSFDLKKSFAEHMDEMAKIVPGCPRYLLDIENVDANQWEKKVHSIISRIKIFEKRLEDKIEHRNSKYISTVFKKIEKRFRDEVKDINIKRLDAFSHFTEALNCAFDGIKEKFDHSEDGFIRMFALPIEINHDKLIPIGWSGAEFDEIRNYSFALDRLNTIDYKIPYPQQKDKILDAASQKLVEMFDANKGDIFQSGWLAGSDVAYIAWERNNKNLKRQNTTFYSYKYALRDFYSVALECYSYIRGVRMELLLETTIQESAHESAHFILPAIDIVENNLVAIPEYMVLPKFNVNYHVYIDSYEKYREEVLESLNQLREINYGSSLIFSPFLKINKSPVQIFELLYKLKKTLNNRALDSHKKIYYYQSENYVTANIDAKYLNHALYNLLDNAIKYGYDGSYIRIHLGVDRKEELLVINVISYGIAIDSDISIYQLFERGKEASQIAKGTGLGMYIVKKICEAHGGNIFHSSELLSNFNIPVLFNYKNRKILGNKNSLGDIESYEKEISRLSESIENEVVCDARFILYAYVFSKTINMPTYRNTFVITIPMN